MLGRTVQRRRQVMQRLLIAAGVLIAIVGLLWPWLSKLPFGRLPGDIVVDRPGFRFFAPFTTMIVLSIVISLILWLMRR
jgi:heme/copper-type cytochrome/quinol oxidase subunit 4